MGKPIRAGGYVIRESGWELDNPPRLTEPSAAEEELDGPPGPAVNEQTGEETPAGEPLPAVLGEQSDRAACPDCGKDVALRKDGTLRKHTCVIEAASPEVTFDNEGA